MSITKHALFSPSSASRWLNCPLSAILSQDIDDTPSERAILGTALHEKASEALTNNSFENLDPIIVGYVKGLLSLDSELKVEDTVSIDTDCFGTVDAWTIIDNHLLVIDLKTGKNPISPRLNEQLLLYALGILKHTKKVIDKVSLVIYQNNKFKVWQPTPYDLEQINFKLQYAINNRGLKRIGYYCRFCPAFDKCNNN